MFNGMFHSLLRALSMGMPKKTLRNTTGRNTMWGVFKAYAVFFSDMLAYTEEKETKS